MKIKFHHHSRCLCHLNVLFYACVDYSFLLRGSLDVKMAPKAVTQREESELQAMLDRLAMEQEEVDGDAPEDA